MCITSATKPSVKPEPTEALLLSCPRRRASRNRRVVLCHNLLLGSTSWEGEAPAEPKPIETSLVTAAQQELRPPNSTLIFSCDKALARDYWIPACAGMMRHLTNP